MNYKGKHVEIDPDNPEALGICDYTGFVHLRRDLVKQMEWRGNALEWTGLYVGRDYADVPNEQLRPPILPPDPVPVIEPRPPLDQVQTYSSNTLGVINKIPFALNQISNLYNGQLNLTEAQKKAQLQSTYFGASL